MDNGTVPQDTNLMKRLAKALGHEYSPYAENQYLKEAAELIEPMYRPKQYERPQKLQNNKLVKLKSLSRVGSAWPF